MQREAIQARLRAGLDAIRSRLTRRRIVLTLTASILIGLVGLTTEAFFRAHLGTAESRLPTALYSRPTPWGTERERGAVPIATVANAAMESRQPVSLKAIPKSLVDAVLAIEDQRFQDHDGLDIKRIGGAFVANVRAGGIAQGGSTITQQLAKNLFLSSERTPLRKAREVALAIALELRYDKRTILEAYLNEIYLGHVGGRAVHGVGAAAQEYFGKDVGKLSLAESALLAGMIRAPNRYTPVRHPDAARARRNLVLQVMATQGRVSESSAEKVQRGKVSLRMRGSTPLDGRYFRDAALTALPRSLPDRGHAIYTTLDARLQSSAARAVERGMSRRNLRGAEAALVALDPRTGEILAMVGGRDYGASQYNRATVARRQPGSAFKPIVALAALEREAGERPAFTLASVVEDTPLRLRTSNGSYEPNNYDGSFRGEVTLREAMEQSLNVPFVRIGMAVGPERIASTAARLGISGRMPAVPSLALGSAEVTLLELTRAYGVLAAGGMLATSRFVLAESEKGGDLQQLGQLSTTNVADPAAVYLVTSALHGVVTQGTGAGLRQRVETTGIAGKTGTSSDYRDAWFVAYTPTLAVGVWVGFDDGRSLNGTGGAVALPIVADFLDAALDNMDHEDFAVPPGITEAQVASADGGWNIFCGASEVFLEGTEPEGAGCVEFEIPRWDGGDDWRDALQRRAERFLEGMISLREERRRARRN